MNKQIKGGSWVVVKYEIVWLVTGYCAYKCMHVWSCVVWILTYIYIYYIYCTLETDTRKSCEVGNCLFVGEGPIPIQIPIPIPCILLACRCCFMRLLLCAPKQWKKGVREELLSGSRATLTTPELQCCMLFLPVVEWVSQKSMCRKLKADIYGWLIQSLKFEPMFISPIILPS